MWDLHIFSKECFVDILVGCVTEKVILINIRAVHEGVIIFEEYE